MIIPSKTTKPLIASNAPGSNETIGSNEPLRPPQTRSPPPPQTRNPVRQFLLSSDYLTNQMPDFGSQNRVYPTLQYHQRTPNRPSTHYLRRGADQTRLWHAKKKVSKKFYESVFLNLASKSHSKAYIYI